MPRANVDLVLEPGSDAPSIAHRPLGRQDHLGSESFESARLLVAKLVTNSVRHASFGSQDGIRLRIVVNAEKVRVEVSDSGPGKEATPTPGYRRPTYS